LVHRILALVPWFLEPLLIATWTFVFFLIAGPQRRAVAANLGAMFPHWSPPRRVLGAWRVFWNFATTLVDAMRFETGTGSVDWAIDGVATIDLLNTTPGGCIILTAHMGNYDLAAPVFASRFNRTLHTVRAPEREPETQAIREREIRRREQSYPGFRTHYNTDGGLLGVELARFLAEGDIVAVQGDRVVFDVSPMEVEITHGLRMRLPKGPMVLARATGAPCYPVFITRDAWRRYRVTVMPEIQLPPRRRGDETEVAALWAAPIYRMARSHWNQWFVFEPVFSREIPG
jgi:lauroyl/myristoyl acyltransferase